MGTFKHLALACVAGAFFTFHGAAFSAPADPGVGAHIQKVSFKNNNGIKIVGNVYFPAGFDKAKSYPAIVTVPPAGGAKEQTAGIYASKMADKGFITIAIDASFQGESGGEPRYKEDPIARVEDIRGSVDYLVSLPYVDESRIGVLGICAGGGYAASAAMTERRIKAVGLAVPVDGGSENRAAGKEATIKTLEAIAEQRTVEARGGKPMVIPWIPDEYKDSDDIDLRGAYQYYRTPRGETPNWQNKMRFVSLDAVMAFDAFAHAEMLLTQPLEVVTGSEIGAYGSTKTGREVYERAASTKKDLLVLNGASHFDLYDNPKYVDKAVTKFDQFFHANLK
ncbi:alpha/beta hydrolase [Pseudomonas sp. B2M1-30]|uniref:alpha/beta hydrolase n=1 Tax=Pseudomonas TaxID=286 RepID=UPI0021CA78C7|nr:MULTISPECIES: alpha/beta hydrolase [Pseudomonas]MCU0120526.1 alpha/beta hydrolase [Pseudomonas sp. B2M1-30]MCU7262544.1 alpha/beta hydrolase [Pseudomonas koreensis]